MWYTPPEIVRYQVRKVDQLLRTTLNCPRGFADPRVVVLDPCCGTAAYLIEVVRCIASDIRGRGDEAVLGAELLQAVSNRVIGFEVLTAPFVIAQLQLFHILSELGAVPDPSHRPAIFLTNALAGWEGPDQVKLNFPELQQEHEAARRVKQQAKIIVILGNPPYNRFAGTAVAEEADLVDHYKGIKREEKTVRRRGGESTPEMGQVGDSLLYSRWGIRKQLLDDLYIRFFRLAEKRIGESAEYGVVSFISNSSYLTGRSHPLMREFILSNFHEVWIDNTHGNRLASERTPWGDSCETLFSFGDGAGIRVGTCISTFLKRKAPATPPDNTVIHYRDFWGKAERKRRALLESLSMETWDSEKRKACEDRPEGPRAYETFAAREASRWMFAPRELNAGYEGWPALDELFPVSYQGVNPNRGLDDSVIDTDRADLVMRMKKYFSAKTFTELTTAMPELMTARARYEPEPVWKSVRGTGFSDAKIKPYLLFPFDQRWLYYETQRHFLNEPRRDLGENLDKNEFLVAVPQPRRPSETRPILASTLFDLHLHDRGSVGFPRQSGAGRLIPPSPNIADSAWDVLRIAWAISTKGGVDQAKRLTVSNLFRIALAILHAPQYQSDHQEALAQDWAQLPIPKDPKLRDALVSLGAEIAILLDPMTNADAVVARKVGNPVRGVGAIRKLGAKTVGEADLVVSIAYYGAGKGRWIERSWAADEEHPECWGKTTGDLYINPQVYFSNVPVALWRYELGGYPVLSKWLGYRQASRRGGQPLTLDERKQFRSIIQRIATLFVLYDTANSLYEQATASTLTAEELGLRK